MSSLTLYTSITAFLIVLYPGFIDCNFSCPIHWYQYEQSCYKYETALNYKRAMDICATYKKKASMIKQSYITVIEAPEEIDFIAETVMKSENVQEIYIGANNFIKKGQKLTWIKSGYKVEVDHDLFCEDPSIDNETFYCGYLKNKPRSALYSAETPKSRYCMNITDCFNTLPFLCEVNCTNQETGCFKWTEEYNRNYTLNMTNFNICLTKYNQCKNDATCIPINVTHHNCECKPGYNGTHCEKDERPCLPHRNRCRNNSTCTQHGWRYNCTCLSGFDGYHCENNIDDCINNKCENGAICKDLINDYECECISFFSGKYCELKNTELVIKEQVSRSFSVFAIAIIIMTFGFFVSLDASKYVFHIEPDSLVQERELIKKKKLAKKVIKDLKSGGKLKKFLRQLIKDMMNNLSKRDPFIIKLEKTFRFSYDVDLRYIDEESDVSRNPSSVSTQSTGSKIKRIFSKKI